MPLRKSASKDAVWGLCRPGGPVNGVMTVSQGVTIRTNNLDVLGGLIGVISVFVMNAKNGWMLVVAADFTFCNQAPARYGFSEVRPSEWQSSEPRCVPACETAKYPRFRWGLPKRFGAVATLYFDTPPQVHGLVKTFAGAIFCLVRARRDVCEHRSAHMAGGRVGDPDSQGAASAGTIFCDSLSIGQNGVSL